MDNFGCIEPPLKKIKSNDAPPQSRVLAPASPTPMSEHAEDEDDNEMSAGLDEDDQNDPDFVCSGENDEMSCTSSSSGDNDSSFDDRSVTDTSSNHVNSDDSGDSDLGTRDVSTHTSGSFVFSLLLSLSFCPQNLLFLILNHLNLLRMFT